MYFSDFADTFKKVSKASGPSKSRAQVIKAKLDKAEKAEKRRQANLLKEAKPQLARQGVTASDLMRETKWADASSRRAGSGTVVTGAVHLAGTAPIDKPVSERVTLAWMDKHKLTNQDAIACR